MYKDYMQRAASDIVAELQVCMHEVKFCLSFA